MLEETNDNLFLNENKTDGNIEKPMQEVNNQEESTPENIIEISNEELSNDSFLTESHPEKIVEEANHHNDDFDDVSILDYETLDMETLVKELDKLVSDEKIMLVKNDVENLKTAFLNKYNHFLEEKKTIFEAEKNDPTEEFHYHLPLKSKFDKLYTTFRDKKNKHFKSLESNLKSNLETRLAIVEELKNLINPQENIKDVFKHFNDLRERWKNAGSIPKDKYNHVWNNYHFHVENFYDYLHMDREARDIDFKHNLELKQRIIARAELLINETDINKAFRELQDLHKIWKEDIGPVSREYREDIWNKFSSITKQMHDKRDVLFEEMRGKEAENLIKKQDIIKEIEQIFEQKANGNALLQEQVKKVENLREVFFSIGKVPPDDNERIREAFKIAVRNFNTNKNSFYKDIKKEQQENLNKKMELVAKAVALQESDDFQATTPIMKQIQEEWKTIGHVPRKVSDKIWEEFRNACNHYFDKLKTQKTEVNEEEEAAFEKKKDYLENNVKITELTGRHKDDLAIIKNHIETWKNFGRVPFPKRHIDGKFNKILDGLFEKLSLSKKDSEMMRFSNRMEQLSDSNDIRKIENEKIFLTKKIQEIQTKIFQLENNIQFFQNTKNAKKENSIVTEVRKNIEKHREDLNIFKDKLNQIKNL